VSTPAEFHPRTLSDLRGHPSRSCAAPLEAGLEDDMTALQCSLGVTIDVGRNVLFIEGPGRLARRVCSDFVGRHILFCDKSS
jgi:hypothetical protein